MMQSWADVENTEMDFSAAPLPLADLVFDDDEPEVEKITNPKVKGFLSKIPKTGPFKVMVTNLPTTISRNVLQREIQAFQIEAEVDYTPGNEYCFLVFQTREQCIDSKNLLGQSIQGRQLGLKASLREQQTYQRTLNTSNKTNRFSNLRDRDSLSKRSNRNGNSQTRRVKHHVPVGGSIRKSSRNKSSSHSTISVRSSNSGNPWESSPKDRENNSYKILNRTNKRDPTMDSKPSRFERERREDRGPRSRAPPRRDQRDQRDTRDMRRTDDDRDGYNNRDNRDFRRRNEERDFSNWRRNDNSGRSSAPPRRQRSMRSQPKPDPDGFTPQSKPVKQSHIKRERQQTQKKKQEEAVDNKKTTRNRFDLFMDEEEE